MQSEGCSQKGMSTKASISAQLMILIDSMGDARVPVAAALTGTALQQETHVHHLQPTHVVRRA